VKRERKNDGGGAPESVRGPLERWWNQVPFPVRKSAEFLWKNTTIRWIVILVLLVLFGSLIGNLLGITNTLLKPISAAITVVLTSKVGRFVVLNIALVLATLFVYRRLRAKTLHLLAARAVDRYLSGLRHMVHRRFALAARDLQVVIDSGKVVDLHTAVVGFPELAEDAALKLAFCHAECDDIARGMRCLEAVPRARLPGHMARTFDEVHALLYDRSPDFLPETKVVELERALASDGKNIRLLRALVDRKVELGDLAGAVDAQKRLVSARGRAASHTDRRRLSYLHYLRALQLCEPEQGAGAPDGRRRVVAELSRAIKACADLALPYVLLGDIHSRSGDPRQALATWGKHPSPPSLSRIESHIAESDQEPRELYREVVAAFPTVGALLAVARDAHRRGDLEMADRILARLMEEGISTPAQELLHGDVMSGLGREQEAEERYRAGVEAFLTSP